jgi:hypothetical protein
VAAVGMRSAYCNAGRARKANIFCDIYNVLRGYCLIRQLSISVVCLTQRRHKSHANARGRV